MIWIVLGLMTLIVLSILVLPLIWPVAGNAPAGDQAMAVYRDQLSSLDAEVQRGTVPAAEADAVRVEIQRRLLRFNPLAPIDSQGFPRRRIYSAILLAVAIPCLAGLLYLRLGRPDLPDRLAAHEAAPPPGHSEQSLATLVEGLAKRMQANPQDHGGWLMLGGSYMQLGRFGDAANAFRQALATDPRDAEGQMGLGEAQVFLANGMVTPAAKQAFEAAFALDPNHAGARYYLAEERWQAGDQRAAFDMWKMLSDDSPPDAPYQEALQDHLREAATALHIPVPPPPVAAAGIATPPAAGAPGPTADQMRDAANMTPEDRQEMIKSMVAQLAEKLRTNPDDFDGWMRLGRARQVLKDLPGALTAFTSAIKLRPDDPQALWSVGNLEAESGSTMLAQEHLQKLLATINPGTSDYKVVKDAIDALQVRRK